MAQGTITGGSGLWDRRGRRRDLWDERVYTQGRRIVGRSARRRPQFLHLCQLDWHNRGAAGARDSFTDGGLIPGEYTSFTFPTRTLPGAVDHRWHAFGQLVFGHAESSARISCSAPKRAATTGRRWEKRWSPAGDKVTVEMSMTIPAKNNSRMPSIIRSCSWSASGSR